MTFRPSSNRQRVARSAVCVRSVLTAVLILAGFTRTEAAVVNAANVSLAAVQTAVNVATIGDTVLVPAGTATWTNTLTIAKDIQIIGAGVGQTIITNYWPKPGGNDGIVWWTSTNSLCRFSGFTFEATSPYVNTFNIVGTSHAFRADHCAFDNTIGSAFVFSAGWVYGVVDHCLFNNVHVPFQVHHDLYGGYVNGNGSWADPDNWGTTNALYIEDCTFTADPAVGYGIADGYGGARIVIRYCISTNVFQGTHGSDTSGASRGARTFEMYCNNFQWPTNQVPNSFPLCVQLRSGTAVIFSNTINGGWKTLLGMAEYRPNVLSAYTPWKSASGDNSWDSNSPTIYDSGTGTATATNLVDNTKSWTINQWVGYSFANTDQKWGTLVVSNNANTIYYPPFDLDYGVANIVYAFTNGDHYQIKKLLAVLDQPGFGQGDLLTNDATGYRQAYNTVTGGQDWPHEVSDPVYVWGNNYTALVGTGLIISENTTVSRNRDYVIGTPKPGYTPLAYPHPLVSSSGAGTGTGTGTGTNSVMPPSELQAHPPGTH